MSVDIQRVRNFNNELKGYKEKASKNEAEIEFNNREIKRICEELTVEMGMDVNPDNIADISKARMEKIINTLTAGEAIIERIRQEEAAEGNESLAGQQQVKPQMQQQVQPQMTQAQPQVQQVQPQVQQVQPQVQQVQPQVQQVQPQMQQQAQPQVQQQAQPFSGTSGMGGFPTFSVGNKPQSEGSDTSNKIDDYDGFWTGTVEI